MKTILLLFFSFSAFSQIYIISGVIKDSTQKPVPMVNVFVKNGEGTVTNDDGEFVLRVTKIPTQIVISHISYRAITLTADSNKPLSLTLKENITALPEAKVGNYAFELLKKAIEKTNADSIYNHFGRGFYRRIQTEGEKYTVLQEIFFNSGVDGKYGISSWQPTASRYTFHDGNVEQKNIVYTTLGNSAPSPRIRFRTDQNIIPVNVITKSYNIEIENFINPDTKNEIAIVLCTPKENGDNKFTGRFYIKTATNGVLRVVGRMIRPKKVWPSGFWFKVKETYMDMDISYQEDVNGAMMLLGMDIDFVVMVQYASSVNRKVLDHIILVMYEYDKLINGEQSALTEKSAPEDQIFATTQASPEFWANNPIIKRTQLEDKIIKIFEGRKKKGGNMFSK